VYFKSYDENLSFRMCLQKIMPKNCIYKLKLSRIRKLWKKISKKGKTADVGDQALEALLARAHGLACPSSM
jgi:hypothetical protein